jgi:hypothetical protein
VDLPQPEREAVEEVRRKHKASHDFLKPDRDRDNELYAQYRGFKHLKSALNRNPSPPDRDEILRAAKDDWGADLVVPKAFSAVETILPRAVAQRPRMIINPDDLSAIDNVGNMRVLIARQQERNAYELEVEETAKSGQIYGLGWQKMLSPAPRQVQRPNMIQRLLRNPQSGAMEPGWVEGPPIVTEESEAWVAMNVDPVDVFYDPHGYDSVNAVDALDYVIHRTWRPTSYVKRLLEQGVWNTEAAKQLDATRLPGSGGQFYDEAHKDRAEIAGFTAKGDSSRDVHEIWEFWSSDGRLITILDREIPVQIAVTPYRHGMLPFAVYRPTTAGRAQLKGIGTIEPMSDLLTELSTLRSQRRDNAALKLAQVFAFSEGAIDLADLQFFPGAAIPVHGEPSDFLYPINVGDIPNSGYNEEEKLKEDLQDVTGLSDTVTGAQLQNSDTATGVQLVQAAANVRIQKQSRRLEVETVARMGRQAVLLNQQRVTTAVELVVPQVPEPGVDKAEWKMVKLTPEELQGLYTVQVEAGSMAPKNMPQQMQLAQALGAMFGQDPHVDQRALTIRQLELVGFENNPEAMLAPSDPPIPPAVLDKLRAMGVDETKIQVAVATAQREDPTYTAPGEQDQRPDLRQAAMNGNGNGNGAAGG